ncbi:energy-coupling factor ABC transporter ATP-binding protein [Paludibacterium sp. B53371]|uniref:energy-coupling factor ABC transporter ATP-binding protein n=1 Tax=Paludibacterium sp. B53371 TaxID=2806263 RepID=UPI001C056EA7|nr:ATP-binding cassette domain-containing protein [Paludibacterium sp. B53371]
MIELNQVSYTYPDGCQALHQLDLSIAAGERVAVLGPNGAGKSTLFQLFNGLLLPSSGQVTVAGLPVCRANLPALRRQVGMVFQDADDQLFNATVYREVAYGPMNMGQRGETLDATVKWALEVVGMSDYLSRNPFNLSGGEKKRLSLACVLAMRPKVLVLDEPTNALDPKAAGMLVSLLNQINRELGVTLLFATHDVDIVPLLADRVFLLDRGRMLLGGSPAEVFNQREVVRAIDLRLPRVAHLAEILMRDGLIPEGPLPLSIGQARTLLRQVLAAEEADRPLTFSSPAPRTCQG